MSRIQTFPTVLFLSLIVQSCWNALPAQEVSRPIVDPNWRIQIRSSAMIAQEMIPTALSDAGSRREVRNDLINSAPSPTIPVLTFNDPMDPMPIPAKSASPVLQAVDSVIPPEPSPKAVQIEEESANPGAPSPNMCGIQRMSYAEAYRSIPFSRTEYEANPGYRHQAAMELMFGAMRPTTMVQQYTPRVIRYPDAYLRPYGRSDTLHINYRNMRGGFDPRSPWGYPYGLTGN